MIERTEIVAKYLTISILASGRHTERDQFKAEAAAWALALHRIPVHHLEECFRRAIANWASDYMMPAAAVTRAYQEMIPELQARAETHGTMQEFLLRTGQGSLDLMTFSEWKERHNLPANWRGTGRMMDLSAEPYPPESNLYKKPVPRLDDKPVRCTRCNDVGWTRRPYDSVAGMGPTLVRCECGQ